MGGEELNKKMVSARDDLHPDPMGSSVVCLYHKVNCASRQEGWPFTPPYLPQPNVQSKEILYRIV